MMNPPKPDRQSKLGHPRGALLVEASLILAIFVTVSFAAIEIGWASMLRQATDNAAYEAARRAIVPGATHSDAEAAATDILGKLGVQTFRFSVVAGRHRDETTHVTVCVEVPIDENAWAMPRFSRGRVIRSEMRLMTDQAPLVLRDPVKRL